MNTKFPVAVAKNTYIVYANDVCVRHNVNKSDENARLGEERVKPATISRLFCPNIRQWQTTFGTGNVITYEKNKHFVCTIQTCKATKKIGCTSALF